MVEEASEFFKEIRLAVTERLTSPLVGTYWISWLIWNFKFVLIIFSGESIGTKFQLIHDEFFWAPVGYARTYGGPLLMTAAFIFIYPYPAEYVYKFRLQFQRRLTQVKQKIEDETLLSVEDGRKLRLEIREKEQNFVARLAEADQQIDDLRRVNESLKAPISGEERSLDKDIRSAEIGSVGAVSDVIEPFSETIANLNPIETAIVRLIKLDPKKYSHEESIIRTIQNQYPRGERVRIRGEVQDALTALRYDHQLLRSGAALDGERSYSFTERGVEFMENY